MNRLYQPTYSEVTMDKSSSSASFDEEASPSDSLLPQDEKTLPVRRLLRRVKFPKLKLVLVTVALLVTHVVVLILGIKLRPDLDRLCFEHTSAYSPVLKEIDSKYTMTQFNGTLGYPSEYTGDPSLELDAVWDKWGYVKYASIPEEEFMKLPGADPDAARLTPEYGGGYIGFLEVSHQLHCLNMMRQAMHQDYYNDPDHPERMAPVFTDRPYTVKMHLQHCVEMFRQYIMCNADVGIITHQWITATPDPFANFNTWHKCRDLSSVEKWIHEHEIPTTPDNSDLPIPLGSKIFAKPP